FVREIPRMDIISRWFQDAFIVVIGHGLAVDLWQKRMCEFILNSRRRPNGQTTKRAGPKNAFMILRRYAPGMAVGEISGLASQAWKHQSQRGPKNAFMILRRYAPGMAVGELSGLASQAWKHQSQRGGNLNYPNKRGSSFGKNLLSLVDQLYEKNIMHEQN
ncbi:171_t:CDS:2, partial [Funneliformis caledonium]